MFDGMTESSVGNLEPETTTGSLVRLRVLVWAKLTADRAIKPPQSSPRNVGLNDGLFNISTWLIVDY
jgi:hypothetical protein